ncbi:MAG: VOC family protein [Candidatus Geothermincolia bacterium]
MHTSKARGSRLLFALALAMAVGSVLLAVGCGTSKPVVNKVDHITIQSPDATSLFAFFTEGLELPTAWPLASYPGYSTGGVQAGNVNIETLQPSATPMSATSPIAFIYGVVFEPAAPLSQLTSELAARGADPSKPKVQETVVEGKTVPMWTNVTLSALCTKNYIVYLCEYTPEYAARLNSHKATPPLGSLGVESMSEIDIISTDVGKTRDEWKKVLAPAPMSSDGLMTIGTGPGVRITLGSSDRITGIVFKVKSVPEAVAFLQKKNLLLSSTATQAKIDPKKAQGIEIKLIQQ